MFYGNTEAEFLRISQAISKIEDLSRNCNQLLSRMSNQHGQIKRIKFSLIKLIQQHQDVYINIANSSLNSSSNIASLNSNEKAMQAISS